MASIAFVPKHVAAGFVDIFVQSGAHLVVGQERHVAGMCDRQYLPVAQKRTPRLEQSAKAHTHMLRLVT